MNLFVPLSTPLLAAGDISLAGSESEALFSSSPGIHVPLISDRRKKLGLADTDKGRALSLGSPLVVSICRAF